VAAFEAGDGDVGLPALADAGAAGGAGDEEGLAAAADAPPEVAGEVGAGAHGDPTGEVDVALGEVGVAGEGFLSLVEEDADALQCDACGLSVGHFWWPFSGFWVRG